MTDTLHLVCPGCNAVNRIPAARLGDRPKCGRCQNPLFDGTPAEADTAGFEQHLRRNEIPVLVDFWAEWCGPCKMMAPAYVEAARQLEPDFRLLKVDTESETALAARYAIRSIPTLILFRGGREVSRHSGATNAGDLVRWARMNVS